jgi:hypothetical protein
MLTRLHSYRRAITTSHRYFPISVRGDPMLCMLTIGVRPGLVNRLQQCAQFHWSPPFIQPRVDVTVEMFPMATLLRFIQLSHGLLTHHTALFVVHDLCNAK